MQSIMGVNDMDNIRSYYSFYPLSLNTGGAKLGKDLLSLNSFREVNIHSYLNPDFSIWQYIRIQKKLNFYDIDIYLYLIWKFWHYPYPIQIREK